MVEASSSSASLVVVAEDGMIQDRRQATNQVLPTRTVAKPIPQAQSQDPREFQLGQIRRRFSPKESRNGSTTILKFGLVPSDPDFPFEMTALDCLLSVPESYPIEVPSLKVGNRDIPRGFTINVEAGFDSLVQENRDATLLELMKVLDKHLEAFLSAPKADTVKLVANKDIRHLTAIPSRAVEPVQRSKPAEFVASGSSTPNPPKPVVYYTASQKAEAEKRRSNETRQLEARMGRLPLYKKSGDGIQYGIPIEPKRRAELPISLRAVKSLQLFVPLLYPLQPCRIQLDGVDQEDARPVHVGFETKATEQAETTLMGHVNYLVQNIHVLAKTVIKQKPEPPAQILEVPETTDAEKEKGKQLEGHQDPDRSHIQYITRPPEWEIIHNEEGSDEESDDDYSYDSGDESDDVSGGVGLENEGTDAPAPLQNAERGTAISFPFMELYGIELLEISILNIKVKCERCKDTTEVKGLKNGIVQNESCKKCASPFAICFRSEFVHANAVRAGFLDLEGCIIGDMLPRYFCSFLFALCHLANIICSTFIPTCSECSTAYPSPGIVSIQGDSTSNVCRECHKKFTFKLPQVKFLRISTTQHLHPAAGPRRKKETLGLTPGTELPKRGRCRHYTKSYRWFRFSCCQKVYACDKCHDDEEDHPNEWANRMICGWCSREGNYRPEDCGFCHGVLIGKKGGGGFWEGGKGTRDKVKMSRKDKRKYRRPGAARAAVKKT